jgi:hypothetical protein
MKTTFKFPELLKSGILIMLCLNFLAMTVKPVFAAIWMSPQKYSDKQLVDITTQAINYSDWADAAIYYSVYIDRQTKSYLENDIWLYQSQKNLDNIIYNARLDQSIAKDVRARNNIAFCAPSMANSAEYRETQANKPISMSLLRVGPPPDEVWVFQDFDFNGPWVSLSIGNYYTATQIGLPDNSASSLMVGNNVIAYLCTDENLQGNCGIFVPMPNYQDPSWNQHPNLTNNTIGNDSVTSIRVEQKNSCIPGPNEVTIFMHFDYHAPCQKLQIGSYNSFYMFGLPDNSVSSIQLGSNVKAYLCPDNNFRGNCEWIYSNVSNLSNDVVGNDSLSSITIESKP